ncbi:carboxymuconolactone decarboxylase family protein [uncultured Chitinophaga sp.]|jgi:alkylhydroperoxidase AhpD family core domain|uniref:carboxymuconolactone decarboxylase family protein n=1 Tax=uncultured Chitinophaga sp. TaxID=339340 RepID=UPI0026333642|nr:carboxymuconolactone decarboxylase family protein [uncultured Chitinophaga sp.]
MKTITVPTRDTVSPANQQIFDNLAKKLGSVPNLFATMALSENALATYLAFSGAKSSLKAKEKEVINLAVSQANGCEYCTAAHTAIAKMNGFTDDQILEIRSGSASFDSKYDVLAKLAISFVETKGKPDGELLDAFYAAGYTNENLVDAITVIADKTFTNYLFGATRIPVDFPAVPSLETVKA